MLIALDFSSDTPIYLQIRNQIVLGIAEGNLQPGERLPSIRTLSNEAGVNMMTVNKAYQLLKQEGYIANYNIVADGVKKTIVIDMKYYNNKPVIEGIERVSKPSCRAYCGVANIPKVRNGLGTVILSTPKGILCGRVAAQENVGGEILCYVW